MEHSFTNMYIRGLGILHFSRFTFIEPSSMLLAHREDYQTTCISVVSSVIFCVKAWASWLPSHPESYIDVIMKWNDMSYQSIHSFRQIQILLTTLLEIHPISYSHSGKLPNPCEIGLTFKIQHSPDDLSSDCNQTQCNTHTHKKNTNQN